MKLSQLPELKVDCRLPDGRLCTRCCWDTQMPLTSRDIKRIVGLGYRVEEFVDYRDEIPVLRNVDGHCVFLDPHHGCKIYPWRPLGCRLYPLVLDAEKCRVILDPLCPRRHSIDRRQARKLAWALLELVQEVYGEIPCRRITVEV